MEIDEFLQDAEAQKSEGNRKHEPIEGIVEIGREKIDGIAKEDDIDQEIEEHIDLFFLCKIQFDLLHREAPENSITIFIK